MLSSFLTSGMLKLTKMKGNGRKFNKNFIDKTLFAWYSSAIFDGVCQVFRGESLYTAWELFFREERFL